MRVWCRVMVMVGLSFVLMAGLGAAEPYEVSFKDPALWEADQAIFEGGSMWLPATSVGGVESSNQAIMLDNTFVGLQFSARLWGSATLECAVPTGVPGAFRSGVTFALYRSLDEHALYATIIIGTSGDAPVPHARGWIIRCLKSQSCIFGAEHVAEVDLGPVDVAAWSRYELWWDAANHAVSFGRDVVAPEDYQVALVPDPFKFPLTKKYFEARASSAACPESVAAGLIEITGVEIVR